MYAKIFSFWCKKVGLKFLNFFCFILDKEKNTSKCSLKLGDFKNIYSSRHIFNIFAFITRFFHKNYWKVNTFFLDKNVQFRGLHELNMRLNVSIISWFMAILYWIRLNIPITSCFRPIVYWDYKIKNTAKMNGELFYYIKQ